MAGGAGAGTGGRDRWRPEKRREAPPPAHKQPPSHIEMCLFVSACMPAGDGEGGQKTVHGPPGSVLV